FNDGLPPAVGEEKLNPLTGMGRPLQRLVNEMRSEGYLARVTSEDDVIIATTRPSAMTSEDA
ncbi:hypothetical protein, partial [Pseudomonas aeruginosa]|uniref:hypothetical protein n=1 Tax=Pseudomonas aeruginosa TaxID=287 RepID=UPI003CE7EB8C